MRQPKTSAERPIRDLLKEKDAFLTTSEKILEFSLRHLRALIITAAALALAVIAGVVFVQNRQALEREAAASYEAALAAASPEAVIRGLEKVREDFPARLAARLAAFSLVGLYAETKALEKALPLAEHLLQTLRPAEISLKPLLLDNIGGLHEALKNYPPAIEAYRALLKLEPLDDRLKQSVLLALGRVQAASGDREGAVRTYEELRAWPESYQAYLANARVAELTGQAAAWPRPSALTAAGEEK